MDVETAFLNLFYCIIHIGLVYVSNACEGSMYFNEKDVKPNNATINVVFHRFLLIETVIILLIEGTVNSVCVQKVQSTFSKNIT